MQNEQMNIAKVKSWLTNSKGALEIVLVIVILITLCVLFKGSKTQVPVVTPNPTYQQLVHKVDSLKDEINILTLQRDSIYNTIDNSTEKVQTINHWYEKKFTDISNQPIAADVQFFTEYISKAGK